MNKYEEILDKFLEFSDMVHEAIVDGGHSEEENARLRELEELCNKGKKAIDWH